MKKSAAALWLGGGIAAAASQGFCLFMLFTRHTALCICTALFNFFKACLRLSCLHLCGVGSMSFSTHFLQVRTMSHREVK